VIVTGRQVEALPQTVEWLDINNVRWDAIAMRSPDDRRPNPDVKSRFAEALKSDGWDLLGFDDHPGVADAYAALGIPTLLVHGTSDSSYNPEPAPVRSLPVAVDAALNKVKEIFANKNADYSDTSSWRSNFDDVAHQMGTTAEHVAEMMVAMKQSRLRALESRKTTPTNEPIIDTKLDRTVYSLISLALALESDE
jgi:hypothetical protein